jgi:hypothetical protein
MMMAAMIVSSARNMPHCRRALSTIPCTSNSFLAGLGVDGHVPPGRNDGRDVGGSAPAATRTTTALKSARRWPEVRRPGAPAVRPARAA